MKRDRRNGDGGGAAHPPPRPLPLSPFTPSSLSIPGNMKYLCAWNKVILRVQRYFAPCLNDSTLLVTTPQPAIQPIPPHSIIIPGGSLFHYAIPPASIYPRVNYFIFENDGNESVIPPPRKLASKLGVYPRQESYPPSSPILVIDAYRLHPINQRSSMSFLTDRRLEADPIHG